MDREITKLQVYTDGGSRGNPGPSAFGVSVQDQQGKIIHEFGKTIGIATNNIAEYSGVLSAFKWIRKNKKKFPKVSSIHFFLDSLLVVQQMNGVFKIKNPNLLPIYLEIHRQKKLLELPVTFTHVPREKNKNADKQVNLALDNNL